MKKIIVFTCATLLVIASCEPPVGDYGGGSSDSSGGNEGQIPGDIVDQVLLDKITTILNQQGNQGGYSAPQNSYGPPLATSGGQIELGKVDQGILVANFVQQDKQQGGYGGGGQSSGGYGRRK